MPAAVSHPIHVDLAGLLPEGSVLWDMYKAAFASPITVKKTSGNATKRRKNIGNRFA